MIINLTLIIQIINIIGAYHLIKYLFFTPYYQALISDEHQERMHIKKVEMSREQVLSKQNELEQHWRACQKQFLQTMPSIHDKRMVHTDSTAIVSKKIEKPVLNKNTITQYAHQFFEKVRNVF